MTGRERESLRRREIVAALGGPAYGPVFAAVRKRIEDNGLRPFVAIKLPPLESSSREALADLLGWRTVRDNRVKLKFAELDAALRSSRVGAGVIQTLEALGGPLIDRRALRAASKAARARLWEEARERVLAGRHPGLVAWLDDLKRAGLARRAARRAEFSEREVLDQALAVLERLPEADVSLAVLAARVTGDPHALDSSSPLSAVVLTGAAHLAGWRSTPASAELRRSLWLEVGVLCDSLSSDVLVHGLRPVGGDPLSRQLCENAEVGEPTRITYRQLRDTHVALPRGTPVYLCENPAIVETVAGELGACSASLICLDGVPSTAAMTLIKQLHHCGATIRFQVDLDCGGLVIGNLLARRFEISPWRVTAEDYDLLLATVKPRKALDKDPPEALWDPRLRARMLKSGAVLYEEQIVAALIDDLRQE